MHLQMHLHFNEMHMHLFHKIIINVIIHVLFKHNLVFHDHFSSSHCYLYLNTFMNYVDGKFYEF